MDSELLVHLSYVLLIAASLVRAIMPLRIFAACSGIAAVVYDFDIHQPSMAAWEAGFALINIVQIGILIYEKRHARLTAEEEALHQRMFNSLSVVDFHRLIRTGTWVSTTEGQTLTVQGESVSRIVIITDGATSVEVDGHIVAYCRTGDFVGEMAFVSGNPATATVKTITDTRYLMWRFVDLKRLVTKHPGISTALQSVFNRNLIEKLSREAVSSDVSN
ncbi:MAG: cyclic nucleotide-binding domain-containing protein [Bradyrhizobiaceae bacterium]|nr:cyclic nucleotide-binding domain-containing protein [Bradyrhizobiaceae bacterium]